MKESVASARVLRSPPKRVCGVNGSGGTLTLSAKSRKRTTMHSLKRMVPFSVMLNLPSRPEKRSSVRKPQSKDTTPLGGSGKVGRLRNVNGLQHVSHMCVMDGQTLASCPTVGPRRWPAIATSMAFIALQVLFTYQCRVLRGAERGSRQVECLPAEARPEPT